jgi:hypothetical protein
MTKGLFGIGRAAQNLSLFGRISEARGAITSSARGLKISMGYMVFLDSTPPHGVGKGEKRFA